MVIRLRWHSVQGISLNRVWGAPPPPIDLVGWPFSSGCTTILFICFLTLLEMWKVNYVCSAFSLDYEAPISICRRIAAETVMPLLRQTKTNSECYHCLFPLFPYQSLFPSPKSITRFSSELKPLSVSVLLGHDRWVSAVFWRKVFISQTPSEV